MPLKPVVNVKCPCCGEVLEIDVAKERVVAHRKGPHLLADRKEGEDVMEVALRNTKAAEERAKNDFAAAQNKLKTESDRLDGLFREAQKKVRENPDLLKDPPTHGPQWD